MREIAEPVVISVLAGVEVPAALWRKHRIGEISASDAGVLCAEFVMDVGGDDLRIPRFAVISVGADVVAGAAEAVARHPLRAYDAIQLASAQLARHALGGLNGFVAFDVALRSAAAAEGFALVPEVIRRPRRSGPAVGTSGWGGGPTPRSASKIRRWVDRPR